MIDGEGLCDQIGQLSSTERQSLRDFLGYIEEQVEASEPLCAYLIRMAKEALSKPRPTSEDDRILN